MRLEDELSAEPVLVVDDQGLDAALAELDGGREARRTASDDEDGDADGLDRLGLVQPGGAGIDTRQFGQALDRLDANAGADELHAGLHGNAVGEDEALRALAVGAEEALGRAVLGVVTEDPDAGREEGRGESLAFQGLEGPALPGEGDSATVGDGQDRVSFDPMHLRPVSLSPNAGPRQRRLL